MAPLDCNCAVPARPDDQGGRAGCGAQEPASLQRHGVAAADLHHPVPRVRRSSWCWAGPGSGGGATSSRPRSTRSWRSGPRDVPTLETDFPGPAYVESVATLNRNLGAQPVMPGNRVDLFPDYDESIAAMTAEIDARHHLGARRVLHHGVGRGDRPVLRGAGARGRARRRRSACSSTTSAHAASRATRSSCARLDAHGDRVAPDAADPAAQGRVAPPGPAQPPQDPGRRRRGRRSPGRRT